MICLVEGAFCYTALINSPYTTAGYITCYFPLTKLLQLSVPFGTFTENDMVVFIIWSHEYAFMFFQLASLISNLFLCHDLIRTLESPFDAAHKRLKWYISGTLIIPFFILILITIKDQDQIFPSELSDLSDYPI